MDIFDTGNDMLENKYMWPFYVGLAGLAWGTYVPIIFYGGSELGARPNSRLMAILCVGLAYFVIGVLFPLTLFLINPGGQYPWPEIKGTGLVFSSLAGVAGAVGAICVVFATQAAMGAARDEGLSGPALSKYRVYLAPLIFSMAPIINVLVSSIWHPKPGEPFHFDLELPGWKLWVGILLVGAGAGLVLFSKEEAEVNKSATGPAKVAPVSPASSKS
jgi:hypothetical protein